MGLHPKNIEIIRQLYCEATTRYSTSAENQISRESPISGVMLDCQLSRWLFCLAINDTIKEVASLKLGYELFSSSYSILAYVYDVEVVSDNPVNLQKMLERLNEKSKTLGLEIDVSRSTAIHIENGKYCHSHQDIFNIEGNIISLQTEESYTKYLYFCRIITDYKPFDNVDQALTELDYDLEKVNKSELAPWQKFQALHKFLMPRIDLLSKSGPLAIKYFEDFHELMEKYARTWANLNEAGKDLLYVPHQNGGFDLTPVKLKPQISTIVLAHKFLQNQDGFQAVAQKSLNEAVQNKCKRSSIEGTDLINYLNGEMKGTSKSKDTSSLWSRIRIYIVHLNKKIKTLKWEGSLESQVLTLNGERLDLESAESKITKAIQDWYFESLISRENKGKIIGCARGPISNHFIKSGSFMDKDDWSFIFRARLDTLPSPRGARQCKTCDGTLAHILECPQNHHKFDSLKNRIVSKIKTAMPKNPNSEKLGEKMKFAETPPDILILDDDKRSALVVNVILAFERDKEALEEARKMNVENCKHQAERLESEGFKVCLEVIVIGKLGSFVELNSAIFEKMKIPGNRADRISKKIVSDVIKESRIIYNDHLSGRDGG